MATVFDNRNYYIWDRYDDLGISLRDSQYVREHSEVLKDERVTSGLARLRAIGYLWYPSRVTLSSDGIRGMEKKMLNAIEISSAIDAASQEGITAWHILGRGDVARRTVETPEGSVRLQGMFFFDENASIDISSFIFSASPGFTPFTNDMALRQEALAALAMNMCYAVAPPPRRRS